MTRQTVEKNTLALHESGLCCSEAILKSVVEACTGESGPAIPKIASGFCKGIGKTGEDICGTVAGGVMALGILFGRMTPDCDNGKVCEATAEFRRAFMDQYGSTNCLRLLETFGTQENMHRCKAMTANAAGMLYDIVTGQSDIGAA